jgi:hypothetical protein
MTVFLDDAQLADCMQPRVQYAASMARDRRMMLRRFFNIGRMP